MTSALRLAAMRAILMFSVGSDGQNHKTVSTNHNLFEETANKKVLLNWTNWRQQKNESCAVGYYSAASWTLWWSWWCSINQEAETEPFSLQGLYHFWLFLVWQKRSCALCVHLIVDSSDSRKVPADDGREIIPFLMMYWAVPACITIWKQLSDLQIWLTFWKCPFCVECIMRACSVKL